MLRMQETLARIELVASSIYFDTDGILRVVHKSGVEMDLKEAKEHAAEICKICNGTPMLMLIDSRDKIIMVTSEARNYLAHHKELIKVRKAHAIIVESLANRLIANFYFKFNKPIGPGKVFNSEKAAIDWLNKYK